MQPALCYLNFSTPSPQVLDGWHLPVVRMKWLRHRRDPHRCFKHAEGACVLKGMGFVPDTPSGLSAQRSALIGLTTQFPFPQTLLSDSATSRVSARSSAHRIHVRVPGWHTTTTNDNTCAPSSGRPPPPADLVQYVWPMHNNALQISIFFRIVTHPHLPTVQGH
jgi:hypothetical protein